MLSAKQIGYHRNFGRKRKYFYYVPKLNFSNKNKLLFIFIFIFYFISSVYIRQKVKFVILSPHLANNNEENERTFLYYRILYFPIFCFTLINFLISKSVWLWYCVHNYIDNPPSNSVLFSLHTHMNQ